jgi:CHAD domain-containing protein
LKQLGAVLGPARDWDVFTAGTGHDVGETFAGDPAIAALLAAAERRRRTSYVTLAHYLDSADWRVLGIALADLALHRPWRHFTPEDPELAARQAELQQATLTSFAARALSKRLDAVAAPGADLSQLTVEALHDIRLHTKRLRYACEFFAPLFPGRETRRFLLRMMELQERLGTLNDGVVAAELMHELQGRGATRHYAIGVVRGFVAARSEGSRRKVDRCWERFRRQEPFWK